MYGIKKTFFAVSSSTKWMVDKGNISKAYSEEGLIK
jgi:hypothetical protein